MSGPVAESALESPEPAKRACEAHAGCALNWNESDSHTPEGHTWLTGNASTIGVAKYKVIPEYAPRTREPIPGAEFVSQDPSCWIYVVQESGFWCTRLQLDYETGDPEYMAFLGTRLDSLFLITTRHPLHHVLLKVTDTREAAVDVGRYLWAREMLRSLVSHQGLSPLQTTVRRIALSFL